MSESRKRWFKVCLVLAVIGIGVSIYSTMHHLEVKATGASDALCNINEQFSCDDIARSEYSEVLDIPLGVWGIGFFAALAMLILLTWRKPSTEMENLSAYAAMVTIGVLASIGLGALSYFKVGTFCVTCIATYVICLLQGVALFLHRKDLPSGFNTGKLLNGGLTGALIVGVIAFGFRTVYGDGTPSPKQANTPVIDQPDPRTLAESKPADIKIHLSAYSGFGEDYRKGKDDAKVQVIEYADFQCPACANAAKSMKEIARIYGDQVSIVFKNYPLDKSCNPSVRSQIHPVACDAAILARCAGQIGKFWQMHDILFDRQRRMSKESVTNWALEVGLSEAQIATCRSSKDMLEKIRDDVKSGDQAGVQATPTIFVNGYQVQGGRSTEALQRQIDRLLYQ